MKKFKTGGFKWFGWLGWLDVQIQDHEHYQNHDHDHDQGHDRDHAATTMK